MLSRVSASARLGKEQEDSGHDRECTRPAAVHADRYRWSGRAAARTGPPDGPGEDAP